MEKKNKILIGSAVYQDNRILKEFLESLVNLKKESFEVEYFFIDDNKDEKSSKLLLEFQDSYKNSVKLFEGYKERADSYNCDEYSHYWSKNLVEKVTIYKNYIIDYFLENHYDYLFFIDSDIVLHPKTIERLLSLDKDIISNIFWTKWGKDTKELPQVWAQDNYSFFTTNSMDEILPNEIKEKEEEFLEMLKLPGTYKVGGLGACTLIKRKVLERGVNFSKLYNLSYWGEDRHFCFRAVANNFDLFVDTYYPSYHIYRVENLKGVKEYKLANKKRDLEILGEQLSYLGKEGLTRYKNYSYDKNNDNSWEKLFSEEFTKRLKVQLSDEEILLKESKFVNSIKVYGYNMNFNKELNSLAGEINFLEYGYKNEKSFFYDKKIFCEISKIENKGWRITDLGKEENLVIEKESIERRVRENPKIVLSMIVKNEGKRYLKSLLETLRDYIDDFVIIDDNSSDNTVEIIKETLLSKNLKLIENKESLFSKEWKLRRLQWDETIKNDPDWILFLDADEFPEIKFLQSIKELISNRDTDSYSFRLYDMWLDDYYREDKYWNANRRFSAFLIRYQPNFNYKFKESNQHCGRVPSNILELPSKNSLLRIKHYGWIKKEDRERKYLRYKSLDPKGKDGSIGQYESILDENVNLVKWIE